MIYLAHFLDEFTNFVCMLKINGNITMYMTLNVDEFPEIYSGRSREGEDLTGGLVKKYQCIIN